MTIFACFATILIPVPYIFFLFGESRDENECMIKILIGLGKRIRARGKWSQASV
jgi:hypothetical protein